MLGDESNESNTQRQNDTFGLVETALLRHLLALSQAAAVPGRALQHE